MSNVDRWPKRIRVVNETGQPGDSDIFDADTGERFMGVFEVHVVKSEITVAATLNWPPTAEDSVINDARGYTGPQHDGIKTTKRIYSVKRMELESW